MSFGREHAEARDLSSPQDAAAARHLAAIVASAGVAIFSETADGVICSWNRAAEQLFGWTAAEVVGQPARRLVPADAHEEHDVLAARVRAGESISNHATSRLTKSGSSIEVALSVSPLCDDAATVTGIATIARDITEQRWLTSDLESSNRQLRAALEDAQGSEERIRSFLGDAAHQLRHPIAGVRACAEALLGDPSQQERQRLLADMVREVARAGRLIASLLRLARLDEGEAITPEPCDLVGVCTDEADRLYSLVPYLDIVLRAEALDDTQPTIDGEAVREILANLLDNARRYAIARIMMTVSVRGDTVRITVSDDGPGLPDDLAERAFERFVTLDSRGGSGLGLPIARSLARAHGGDLQYDDGAFVVQVSTAAAHASTAASD